MKVVLMALMAARLGAAGEAALDLLPADTKVVFGIHVAPIAASALFRDADADTRKLGEEMLKAIALAGLPVHDIDEILIASSADSEKAEALLVLRGRFDFDPNGAGSGAGSYHGVALLGRRTGGTAALAVLDESTAVAGEVKAVRAAIDRRGQAAALDARLSARVEWMREHFDIWGTGERPEGFIAPTGKRDELDLMDRFEIGVTVSRGLEVGAEFHTRSQKDADKLAASLQLVKAMMAAQGPKGPKFSLEAKEGTVKISLSISEEDLKTAIAAQKRTAAPNGGLPTVVGSEAAHSSPSTGDSSGTTVFVLPGKK